MYHLFVKNVYFYLQLSFVVSDVQDGQLSKNVNLDYDSFLV